MIESFFKKSRLFLAIFLILLVPTMVMAEEKNDISNKSQDIASTSSADVSVENSVEEGESSREEVKDEITKDRSEMSSDLLFDKENLSTQDNVKESDEREEDKFSKEDDNKEILDKQESASEADQSEISTANEKKSGNKIEADNKDSKDEIGKQNEEISKESEKGNSKEDASLEEKTDSSEESEKTTESSKKSEDKMDETKEETEAKEVVEPKSDANYSEENNDKTATSDSSTDDTDNQFEISIISDTHIFPEEMVGNNADYTIALNSDRKLLTESVGILKRALEMIDKRGSKYLFISGDLTKDGELKAHQKLAEMLTEWQNKGEGRQVFIVTGNHDINNRHAFDYSSGKKELADRTSPDQFIDNYKELVYDRKNIISKYNESDYFKNYLEEVNEKLGRSLPYAQGYTSYVARLKNKKGEDINGLTLINLDTAIYSADVTSNGSEFQETSGTLTLPMIKWIIKEAEEANKRNDVVTLMSHHAFLPHFENQEHFLSPYIINTWDTKFKDSDERINDKTPAQIMADLGIKFLFTGHLHAHDAAKYVSPEGNEFFDIQTGSTVTYPLPIRHIVITNNISKDKSFSLDMNTDLIDHFTFTNPETGEEVTVEDATSYASKNQLTPELVAGLANYYLESYDINNFNSKKTILGLFKGLGIDLPEEGYGEQLIPIIGGFLGKDGITKNMQGAKITVSIKDIENTEKYGEGKKIAIDVTAFNSDNHLLIRGQKLEESLNSIFSQIDEKIVTKENINKWTLVLVKSIMEYPIYTSEDGKTVKTFSDLANDSYRAYLKGDEKQPQYITEVIKKYRAKDQDLLKDLLNHANKELDAIVSDAASKIEYKIDGLEGPGNPNIKFVKNLIEDEGQELWGEVIKAMVTQMIGKNLSDTLKNETIVEMFYGKDSGKKEIAGSDIVNKVMGISFVQDKLNGLVKGLGANTVTELAINVVDGMTNENNGRYKYYFQPDGTYKFVKEVSPKEMGEVILSQGKEINGMTDIKPDYKLEKIIIKLNGKEDIETNANDLNQTLKSLEANLQNGDKITMEVIVSNKFSNKFTLSSELTYKKDGANLDDKKDDNNDNSKDDGKDKENTGKDNGKDDTDEKPIIIDNNEKNSPVRDSNFNIISLESTANNKVKAVINQIIITLEKYSVKAEDSIKVSLGNGEAKKIYKLVLEGYGQVGTITTDEFGKANIEFKLPKDIKAGTYKLFLEDEAGNILDTKIITVNDELQVA